MRQAIGLVAEQMWQLLVKALLSGMIVACASEAAKRYPTVGGLIASLLLVAILSMIWLWRDQPDSAALSRLSTSTFWFVLPSLPMFLAIPALLNRNWSLRRIAKTAERAGRFGPR